MKVFFGSSNEKLNSSVVARPSLRAILMYHLLVQPTIPSRVVSVLLYTRNLSEGDLTGLYLSRGPLTCQSSRSPRGAYDAALETLEEQDPDVDYVA